MKKILAVLFVFFVSFTALAQEKSAAKWTRFEFENKNFAISFPPGFIIDAEKRDGGQRYRIIAYLNGVKMELKINKDGNARSWVKALSFLSPDWKISDFTAGNFLGKRLTSEEFEKEYFEYLYLGSDDFHYYVSVKAKSKNKDELKRFLFSVILGGKPLFQQKEKSTFEEETVSLETIKTSAEVSEAYTRKIEKKEIKISYESDSSQDEEINYEKLTRLPIILERPIPALNPRDVLEGSSTHIAKLKVNFLADGQIGDIIVYSNSKKDFMKACVEAARKIRFIPAQIDGKNVDAVVIVDYTLQIYSTPSRVM